MSGPDTSTDTPNAGKAKPFYQSKTMRVNAALIVIGLISSIWPGSPIADALQSLAGEDGENVGALIGAVTMTVGAANVVLRAVTRTAVEFFEED